MGNYALILFFIAFVALILQQVTGYVQNLQYEVDDSVHDVSIATMPTNFKCPKNACQYTKIDGVETFQLLNRHSNRLEVKVHNTYTSGTHVFQGQLRISTPLFDECLFQIFGGHGKATQFMLRGYSAGNGGKISRYQHDVLATGIDNTWVDVRIVHAQDHYVEAFINNVSKGKWQDTDHHVPNIFKYGIYGTLKTSNARVEWRNVSIS